VRVIASENSLLSASTRTNSFSHFLLRFISHALQSKLGQNAQVVLEDQAQVVDLEPRMAVRSRPNAEGPAE
jgi:hypothetical protein